jgi:PPK2 family polyphosphate:nucleotide phosphotransferase
MASDLAQRYRVAEGTRLRLADHDADETEDYGSKAEAQIELAELRDAIAERQARLYAEGRRGLLIVLQALDTGGKDGAIKGVFRGVNPQGCQVFAFRAPSEEERSHDFLWRYHAKAPSRGMITIFNRSHYEDVLVVRVQDLVGEEVWRPRYELIRDFERSLVREGTTVLKFFLHISKDEQRRRLQSRLDDPAKHWKFNPGDLKDRARWDDFTAAYEDALSETSTGAAPWFVVPSNHKWFRNLVIARTIAATLEEMDPQFPPSAPGLDEIVID